MKLLAIETSCDETAVAILDCSGDEKHAKFEVLGNALLSQIEIHKQYGGVVPMLAKREHQKNLPHLFDAAFKEAKIREEDVDAIAVTAGPGLEPALWVGITFGKALAQRLGKPLIAVNHMEGHFLSSLVRDGEIRNVALPALGLLISGGHTELVLMKEWGQYELVGQTRDDAVGEAFDKVARLLGLSYPGGPEISRLAETARRENQNSDFRLPRPMINSNDCDFSFAGLKTAVLYLLKAKGEIIEDEKRQIALEFENAAADVLWAKTKRALEETGAKTLAMGGGVSANTHIRRVFVENMRREYTDISVHIPEKEMTTDNAVMIAITSYYRALRSEYVQSFDELRASGNLSLDN